MTSTKIKSSFEKYNIFCSTSIRGFRDRTLVDKQERSKCRKRHLGKKTGKGEQVLDASRADQDLMQERKGWKSLITKGSNASVLKG